MQAGRSTRRSTNASRVTTSAQKLVRYLLDTGLIDAASVVDGKLLINDSTRRHRNFKVAVRGAPGCFVKQVQAGQAMADQSLHREAVCYWLVANDPRFGALRALLPAFRGYDGSHQTLVLELLPEAENITEYHQRLGHFPVDVAALLGTELGRAHMGVGADLAHRGTPGTGLDVFPRAVPWILSIHTMLATQFERLSSANAQILDIVRQYPEFQSTLDALRAAWHVNGLIHGDMKWDNCLVTSGPQDPARRRLYIVDWELADFGDVCWDVGAIFQSYLSTWILSMPQHDEVRAELLLAQAKSPLDAMQPAIAAFWQSYLAVRDASPEAAAALLTRCVQYAAARMIQTAYEHMSYAPAVTASTLRMLQVSINVLIRPADAIRDLLGLAGTAQ